MITVFIDTEFNGFNGELISLSLVSESWMDDAFYKVYPIPDEPVEAWVQKNVIPYLYPTGITESEESLKDWLINLAEINQTDTINIVADWPDDIRYFCEQLITAPGEMIDLSGIKLTFDLELNACEGPFFPAIPHNALSDAAANRENWIYNKYSDEEE